MKLNIFIFLPSNKLIWFSGLNCSYLSGGAFRCPVKPTANNSKLDINSFRTCGEKKNVNLIFIYLFYTVDLPHCSIKMKS